MRRAIRFGLLLTFSAALALGSTSEARADIVIAVGNNPQVDESVVLTNGTTGNPINGQTSETLIDVGFTSNESLKVSGNKIQAGDGAFTYLMVDVPGGSFTSLILNLDAAIDGTLDIRAQDTDGQQFTMNAGVTGTGSNFFTVTAINGQRIAWVDVTADVPLTFVDAAQFRVGGAQLASTVPEPASMLLLGTGLMGFAVLRRRAARKP